MKEFSGLMRVEIEVIIEAKNQREAEKIFDDIYPNISIEKEGSHKILILDERNNLDCIEWEINEITYHLSVSPQNFRSKKMLAQENSDWEIEAQMWAYNQGIDGEMLNWIWEKAKSKKEFYDLCYEELNQRPKCDYTEEMEEIICSIFESY